MSTATHPSLSADLASRVEAFEAALAADPAADPAGFLPRPDHLLYRPLLAELVRVDLEHARDRGQCVRVPAYLVKFPAVLTHADALAAVAREEYRQRQQDGEPVSPADFRVAYGVDTADWPAAGPPTQRMRGPAAPRDDLPPTSLVQTPPPGRSGMSSVAIPEVLLAGGGAGGLFEPGAAAQLAGLLAVGGEFLGFRLEEEIGRGAYGRVFLARQGDLAGRPVALKVSLDAAGESRALAQLQHPNIVPVHSLHRVGPFQAVCMPYLGRATLAEVVRHVRNRSSLPLSGKELHSTVARRARTAGGKSSSFRPAAAPSAPAAPEAPAADGWGRVADLPYADAVLTLALEIADGLAHAHARGIVHRDLKPANVLLSDDGRAMLLDFNLAEDTKARPPAGEATVGGTLPYMAPEHLDAYRVGRGEIDARCDVYALGVILFELLTGRHPYPDRHGRPKEVTAEMAADRRQPPPLLRPLNPAVSPAVEGLVRKCLAPDPADRYQTAADLAADIRHHLSHRPLRHAPNPSARERLRKFARRNPRLASSGAVAAVAALVLFAAAAAFVYTRERTRGLEARGRLADHQTAFRDAQLFLDDRNRSWPRLDEGLARLRGVLDRYGAADGGDWLAAPAVRYLPDADRDRVRQDVGETYYLMAQVAHLKAAVAVHPAERAAELDRAGRWNELADRYAGDRLPRAVREQKAALAALAGAAAPADPPPAPGSARDRFLVGAQLARGGRPRDALPHLTEATKLDPTNVSAWFVRGTAHLGLEQNELAAVCFGACVALRPDFAPGWLNRGVAFTRLRLLTAARDDYDRALELDPALADAYVLRAGVRDAGGDVRGAADDLTAALAAGASPVRVHFLRAAARDRLGDKAAAAADREAGLKLTPTDELSWVARGEVRKARDPAGALADADAALKVNPLSVQAMQLKAHLLAEHLGRPAEAIAVLDRAVGFYPDYVRARAGRAVLLARAGRRDEAVRDAKDALLRDTRPPNLYQVACAYALTAKTHPGDKTEAFRLLASALRGGFGHDLIDTDTDLAALRPDPEFQRLVAAAKAQRPAAR
ncbi:MAG TPA: protein kinase [Urbifossiella sp.]|jgi:serine/threonine protein kinase/predicted Zn-dependent protease|nr:protein kinase [Urbifossiella sp.]